MQLVMIASEANPYVKPGGLADVVYSLSKELASLGEEVSINMPTNLASLRQQISEKFMFSNNVLKIPKATMLLTFTLPSFIAISDMAAFITFILSAIFIFSFSYALRLASVPSIKKNVPFFNRHILT